MYLCNTFEAIHNKDYSVVKTSKAGSQGLAFFSLSQRITNHFGFSKHKRRQNPTRSSAMVTMSLTLLIIFLFAETERNPSPHALPVKREISPDITGSFGKKTDQSPEQRQIQLW
ncbi:MAG: hypothetical protein SPL47_09545 [Bacteroidales bacterium]|nr:hypothetical protein [Bacteroidales bacterium]